MAARIRIPLILFRRVGKKSMIKSQNYIPEKLYREIVKNMPISCVDVVIAGRGKFLMGKRKNKPAQGKWWFVGGRIRKGERLEQAVCRHVKTETGVSQVKIKKILGTTETFFKDSAQGPGTHTVNTTFFVEIPRGKVFLSVNSDNSELVWFSKIDKSWHPCVRQMLRSAGFK